LTTDPAGP